MKNLSAAEYVDENLDFVFVFVRDDIEDFSRAGDLVESGARHVGLELDALFGDEKTAVFPDVIAVLFWALLSFIEAEISRDNDGFVAFCEL